jgi:hypothetical protein
MYSSFLPKNSLNWILHMALFGKSSLVKPRKAVETFGGLGKDTDKVLSKYSSGATQEPKSKGLSSLYDLWKSKAAAKTGVANAPWAPEVDNSEDASSAVDSDEGLSAAKANEILKGIMRPKVANATANDSVAPAAESIPAEQLEQSDSSDNLVHINASSPSTTRKFEASDKSSSSSCVTTTHSTSNNKKTIENLTAKIQAREAFYVFLENILKRLRSYYEQSDPSTTIDVEYIRQQVEIINKFLAQAKETSVGKNLDSEDDEPTAELSAESITNMATLTEKLESFLKSYKRQTDRFKNECFMNGRIAGTSNAWIASSVSPASSRASSRPSSASKTGRTPIHQAHNVGAQTPLTIAKSSIGLEPPLRSTENATTAMGPHGGISQTTNASATSPLITYTLPAKPPYSAFDSPTNTMPER